jgi:hypothetical protein
MGTSYSGSGRFGLQPFRRRGFENGSNVGLTTRNQLNIESSKQHKP